MLEAINATAIPPQQLDSAQTTPFRGFNAKEPKQASEPISEEKAQPAEEIELSQSFLDGLQKDIETVHNVGLKFSMHDGTGRTLIKVIDKNTEELIREIPPEGVLDLAAKIDEMLGIIFDKKV